MGSILTNRRRESRTEGVREDRWIAGDKEGGLYRVSLKNKSLLDGQNREGARSSAGGEGRE